MSPFSHRGALGGRENALTRTLADLREAGRSWLDLSVSNPTEAGLAFDQGGLLKQLTSPEALHYQPTSAGLSSARRAVALHHAQLTGTRVDAEQVLLTASTSEAYAYLFKLLCDPGDCVWTPRPGYPLFDMLAQLEGVETLRYDLHYDGRWSLAPDALLDTLGARAVIAVSPSNPTGNCLQQWELDRMLQTGLPVICDEVFSSYLHQQDEGALRTVHGGQRGLTFCLGGLSKQAGLPQLKLAWIIVGGEPARAAESLERLSWIADAYLSPSAPVQHAAERLLETGKARQAQIQQRCHQNLQWLRERFERCDHCDLLHTEAGWYACLRVPATQDDEAWCLELLREAGVRLQPGYFYDMQGGAHLIISLLTPRETLRQGVERVQAQVLRSIGR